MSAIFRGIKAAATLSTVPRPPTLASSTASGHPHIVIVGDQVVILGPLDWGTHARGVSQSAF
jgi:hypothetical protein